MLEHKNPEIMVYKEEKSSDKLEDHFLTGKDGFMLAVALDNFGYPEDVIDEKYVKWVAKYYVKNPEQRRIEEIYIQMHQCTEEDFKKFYPSNNRTMKRIQKFKISGNMYCLDWQENNLPLFGSWREGNNFAAIDIMAVPCGMRYRTR